MFTQQERMNKEELVELIESLKLNKNEYWILSSGALVIRGIYPDAGDLDIAVTEKGLQELKNNYNLQEKRKGCYIVQDRIECVVDTKEARKMEKYEGFNLQSIEMYYEFLKNSSREKDKSRIPLIEDYMKNRKTKCETRKTKEKISSMAIVIAKLREERKVLLLNSEGEWVFPKGHVEEDETYLETAIRELKEESSVTVTKEESLGQVDEFKFYFDKEDALKIIKVFAFEINELREIKYNKEECFIDGKLLDSGIAIKILKHDDARNALKKALEISSKKIEIYETK